MEQSDAPPQWDADALQREELFILSNLVSLYDLFPKTPLTSHNEMRVSAGSVDLIVLILIGRPMDIL